MDLEKLNKDLSEYLSGVENFVSDVEANGATGAAASTSRGQDVESDSESEHDTSNSQTSWSQRAQGATRAGTSAKEASVRESIDLVSRLSETTGNNPSAPATDLIVRLTSLLMQIKSLVNMNSSLIEQRLELGRDVAKNEEIENSTNHHFMPFSTKCLTESINEIKNGLHSTANSQLFEDKVLIHMSHIESALCHYNKLNAFKS